MKLLTSTMLIETVWADYWKNDKVLAAQLICLKKTKCKRRTVGRYIKDGEQSYLGVMSDCSLKSFQLFFLCQSTFHRYPKK